MTVMGRDYGKGSGMAPARPAGDLQGAVGGRRDRRRQRYRRRHRGRDRRRGRRRRRRHQLLDLRQRIDVREPDRSRVPAARPRRACSSRPAPATPVRAQATVGKTYPWVTTVATGTHDRDVQTTVTLGDGKSYTGVGHRCRYAAARRSSSAKDAGLPNADPANLALCQAGHARPGQGHRQDRGLRPRRSTPASTRACR